MKFKGLIEKLPDTCMKFIDDWWEYWFILPIVLGGLVIYIVWFK